MFHRSAIAAFVIFCAATALAARCSICLGQEPAGPSPPSAEDAHRFFAFCFDTHDARERDLEQQAAMLKRLGFDGAGHVGLDAPLLAQRIESLDRAGLKLFLAGMPVDLRQGAEEPLQLLDRALPLLAGRDVLVYITLTGYPPRDPRGDEPGIALLRALADRAAPSGVRIAIYPHTSDWVAELAHAADVAGKVDRSNCGVIFNLCHFLRNEDPATMAAVLRAARGRLMAVTLNGADLAGKTDPDWQRLIQPLDCGSFDLSGLLGELKQSGYRGPIGLMCYGIGGDAELHLARSIARWRELRCALE